MNEPIRAKLYAAELPTKEQKARFLAFLRKKYGENVSLVFEKTDAFPGGFRLEVGAEVYDWSVNGRFRQLRDILTEVPKKNGDVIPLLSDAVQAWAPKAVSEELGTVISVGDGVATVSGLGRVSYGEIVEFSSGVRGMVQDLKRDSVGCILFGDDELVSEGGAVRRTMKTAGVPVGKNFLGRAVNALGAAIDGKGEIGADGYRPIEVSAPRIIDRQPVNRPLETGLIAIDSMFPIGRGQRELIIGDRQTGKTAIALDTILNQRGKDVICIYVAIGQKASSVAQLMEVLRSRGALDYCIIVSASAGESASMQYIAPYAGCAMGEYFMEMGKDVLIVYDDLSKHAVAYRTLSLLLGRSPGREAYPGDVFYLHSRLLERAAHLSDERGGGSMTALPIVETQSGDVSAYIPTNIISITDGQIFLESSLFFAGQRPAVNVGLSVSRVGGSAQYPAIRKLASKLRLDLAHYRELAVFSQFGGDMDESTGKILESGRKITEILKQAEGAPMSVDKQIIYLYLINGHIDNVPIARIKEYMEGFYQYFVNSDYSDLKTLRKQGVLTDEIRKVLDADVINYDIYFFKEKKDDAER